MDLSGFSTAGYSDLISFVQGTINFIVAISALIAVGYLVWAGIQYILSAGDEGKIEKAQKTIIYALVGLIIVFISPLIIRFILTEVLGSI